MARWVGQEPPPFTGTKHGVTVYRLNDPELYYVRMQSSITGKRIKKDPVFKGFRNSAVRLSDASRIASKIYRQLSVKKHTMYREITGKAILLLKAGKQEDIIMARLTEEYLPKVVGAAEPIPVSVSAPVVVQIPVSVVVEVSVPVLVPVAKPFIRKNLPPKRFYKTILQYKSPSISNKCRAAPG